MTTNFRKICGILFLAAMTVVSAPSGAWGEETENSPSIPQDPLSFLRSKKLNQWADTLEGAKEDSNVIMCGEALCDLSKNKCWDCEYTDAALLHIANREFHRLNCREKSWTPPPVESAKNFGQHVLGIVYSGEIYHGCTEVSKNSANTFSADLLGFIPMNDKVIDTCMTTGGEHPQTFCLKLDKGNVEVNYGNETGGFKNCEVLPVKLYNQRKCFFCPLFKVLFTAADSMTSTSFAKLGTAFKSLIGIGLALWIAVQTLAHVSSLTKQDAPKFLGGLIKQSAKFLIAFLLLANSQEVYHLGVNPILQSGLKFGSELAAGNVRISDAKIIEYNNLILTDPGADYLYGNSSSTQVDSDGKKTITQRSLYVDIAIFISKVQYEIAFMQAVGSSLLCVGGHGMFSSTKGLKFGDGFQMAIQGLLLVIFGLLLSLAFAFYLIDAVVQLGIVGALMPFLIACWPFKITSSYTGKGMQILLNSFFVFVFLGLVIRVNLDLVDAGIKNVASATTSTTADNAKKGDTKETETAEEALGGLLPIYNAINNQDVDKLKKLTDISTVGFLILVVCCLFGFKLSGKADELAGKMSGGAISGIGTYIGGMAASAAKGAALKTTAPIRQAAWNKTKDIAKATPGAVGRGAKTVGRGIKNLFNRKSGTVPPSSPEGPAPSGAGAPLVGATTGRQPSVVSSSSTVGAVSPDNPTRISPIVGGSSTSGDEQKKKPLAVSPVNSEISAAPSSDGETLVNETQQRGPAKRMPRSETLTASSSDEGKPSDQTLQSDSEEKAPPAKKEQSEPQEKLSPKKAGKRVAAQAPNTTNGSGKNRKNTKGSRKSRQRTLDQRRRRK